MTFEQVVLLLSLLGGAIYVTFQITWTISNGKKKFFVPFRVMPKGARPPALADSTFTPPLWAVLLV